MIAKVRGVYKTENIPYTFQEKKSNEIIQKIPKNLNICHAFSYDFNGLTNLFMLGLEYSLIILVNNDNDNIRRLQDY